MTANASAGYSAASSIAQSLVGAYVGSKAISSQKKAAIQNIEANKDNYLRRITAASEQTQSIDRELGRAMSARGLEAMKAEARLRTAGASTGLSGASIDELAEQSGYDQILDNQILISRARTSKANVQRDLLVDYMNFKAQGSNITSSMQGGSGLGSALLKGLTSGASTYSSYIQAGGKDIFGDSLSQYFNYGKTSAGVTYDTGFMSEQSRMLAEQDKGLF